MIARELTNRYRGTVFGVLWLGLQPLLMVAVYTFVFSVILKVRMGGMDNPYHYVVYLIAAMLPYFAFQEAVLMASQSLFANSEILKKSTLPPILFPLVPVLSTLVTEGIAIVIVIIAARVLLGQLHVSILFLPIVMLVRLLLSISIAWFVSVMAVFIQDLRQAIGLLLTLLMFVTPVLYPVEMVPKAYLPINNLNPFFHLLEAYRAVLINGELPALGFYWVFLLSVSLLLISALFFQHTIDRAKEFV